MGGQACIERAPGDRSLLARLSHDENDQPEEVPMLVSNLMTQNPRSCHVGDNLAAAAQIMWEADCGAVPVVDDQQKLVGIVTDRDICMAAYTRGEVLRNIPVRVAMARDVITCGSAESVERAERAMRDARVRRLPVVDGEGRLLGIVSLNDLAREAFHAGKEDAPRPNDVAETLAAICEPRFQMATTGDTRPTA
jgi:CBS domain-containing protein